MGPGANDAVFVPASWRHWVKNLDDCISLNTNLVNAANVIRVWDCIRDEHEVCLLLPVALPCHAPRNALFPQKKGLKTKKIMFFPKHDCDSITLRL